MLPYETLTQIFGYFFQDQMLISTKTDLISTNLNVTESCLI